MRTRKWRGSKCPALQQVGGQHDTTRGKGLSKWPRAPMRSFPSPCLFSFLQKTMNFGGRSLGSTTPTHRPLDLVSAAHPQVRDAQESGVRAIEQSTRSSASPAKSSSPTLSPALSHTPDGFLFPREEGSHTLHLHAFQD